MAYAGWARSPRSSPRRPKCSLAVSEALDDYFNRKPEIETLIFGGMVTKKDKPISSELETELVAVMANALDYKDIARGNEVGEPSSIRVGLLDTWRSAQQDPYPEPVQWLRKRWTFRYTSRAG